MEHILKLSSKRSLLANVILVFVLSLAGGYFLFHLNILKLQDFCIILTGIIIQAFPFLILGTLVSSLISIFVSNDFIVKLFPKKGFFAIVSSIAVGFFLPLCDCSVIPVAARLKRKGVPIFAIVSFIMAAPIVNPIVIIATHIAFGYSWKIAIYRFAAGIIIAVLSGIFLGMFYSDGQDILKDEDDSDKSSDCCCCSHEHHHQETHKNCSCGHDHHDEIEHCSCGHENEHNRIEKACDCGHEHVEQHASDKRINFKDKLNRALIHTGDEFFQVAKLFIVGASISAAIQTFLPKDVLTGATSGVVLSVFIMMLVAYIMSICSTSDAFIARSFITSVPIQGIFAFIVFGPAIDLKNTIMMSGYFKKKFIMEFLVVSFVTALVVLIIAGSLLF